MEIIIYILFIIATGFSTFVLIYRHFNKDTIYEAVKRKIKGFRSVLLVDDDELQQDLVRHNMIPPDCKIHVAKSSDEALELIHSNEYDLILLDIKLAGKNGGNVLKTIRAEGNETSVVIITGYADSQVYNMSMKYDAPVIEKQHLFTHFKAWSKAFKQI